jgi:transcriptional regulator with XRE-family HTH domain
MEIQDVRATLGRNLRLYRRRKAMSQAVLAENAGISITFLSDIERGNKWPYMETLIYLAEALEVEVFELLKPETEVPDEAYQAVSRALEDFSAAVKLSFDSSVNHALEKIKESYIAP